MYYYYKEEVIDGILCYRSTPEVEWRPLSLQELTARVTYADRIVAMLPTPQPQDAMATTDTTQRALELIAWGTLDDMRAFLLKNNRDVRSQAQRAELQQSVASVALEDIRKQNAK